MNSTEKAVLNSQDTLEEVIDCLTEHISIKTQGACNQTDLFNIFSRWTSFIQWRSPLNKTCPSTGDNAGEL